MSAPFNGGRENAPREARISLNQRNIGISREAKCCWSSCAVFFWVLFDSGQSGSRTKRRASFRRFPPLRSKSSLKIAVAVEAAEEASKGNGEHAAAGHPRDGRGAHESARDVRGGAVREGPPALPGDPADFAPVHPPDAEDGGTPAVASGNLLLCHHQFLLANPKSLFHIC